MSEILEFPFDSGAYEAADRKWLPPQMLAIAENVRLDRDGRLAVRPGATDLGLETQSSTDLTPYDLGNYQTRLVALGTQRTNQTGIQELFEYVESASSWRGSSGADEKAGVSIRIPTLTKQTKTTP